MAMTNFSTATEKNIAFVVSQWSDTSLSSGAVASIRSCEGRTGKEEQGWKRIGVAMAFKFVCIVLLFSNGLD
jgi:hypothetical protein